jgi:hypothetical protein
MGFVGRFAASWKTGARKLTAAIVIFGLACSIEQLVSGPVTLTGEWTTVTPPEPLRVAGKGQQVVCLQVVGTLSDVDFKRGAALVNGQWHVLAGEAVDAEQTNYPLQVGDQGGNTTCLYRAGEHPPGPDFPGDIVKLRLRSEPPLQLEGIRWHSYDQK